MTAPLPKILPLEEDLLVRNYAVILEGGEDAHLIEGVFDLFFGEVGQFHFLQRVDLAVGQPLHSEHRGVCSLASVGEDVPSFGPTSKSFKDINNYKGIENNYPSSGEHPGEAKGGVLGLEGDWFTIGVGVGYNDFGGSLGGEGSWSFLFGVSTCVLFRQGTHCNSAFWVGFRPPCLFLGNPCKSRHVSFALLPHKYQRLGMMHIRI